jgi:hypothetical protein
MTKKGFFISCYLYYYDSKSRAGEHVFDVNGKTKLEALFALKKEIKYLIDMQKELSNE